MAASEHTPHYQLSQFGPDDRPSWIDDYNADMRQSDTSIFAAQSEAIEAKNKAGDAWRRADVALNRAVDSKSYLAAMGVNSEQSGADFLNRVERIEADAASKTVYNYFTWNGSELITLMTSGTDDTIAIANQSQTGGIGDNDAISLIHDGTGIQINQDGIYVVWSTITTSLFVPDNTNNNPTTALSLVCDKDGLNGPEKTEIINGSFITPLTPKIEIAHPPQEKAQTLTIPPTIVSMNAGGFMALALAGNQNMAGNIKLYHLETRTCIIKIR